MAPDDEDSVSIYGDAEDNLINPLLKEAVLHIIQSIAKSSKKEKEELFVVMSNKMEEINTDNLAIDAQGLKKYENKKEFIEAIKREIKDIEIRDVNIEIINKALKQVNTSALRRVEEAAKNDINKSDTNNILDRLRKVENLHGDERIKEICHIIVFSPIYLLEAVVSILAIGIRHLIKDVPEIVEKIGKEVVHQSKNVVDTLQFWKDTRLEKFLLDIGEGKEGGEDYRSFSPQGYIVPDEQRTFAIAYRDNPQIIDIIQEKMGANSYLTVNAGDEKIDITKSDCEKFKEKAASKRGGDKDDFHALLGGLSNIVQDTDLWKEVQSRANEMKQSPDTPSPDLADPSVSTVVDQGRGLGGE